MTPSRPWLLAYRLTGVRLPEPFRPWVAQDLTTTPYRFWRLLRSLLGWAVLVGLYAVGSHATAGRWPSRTTLMRLGFLVLVALYLGFRDRAGDARKTLAFQRIDAAGNPVPPAGLLPSLSTAHAILLVVALLVAWTGAAAELGDAQTPTTAPVSKPKCVPVSADDRARIEAGISVPGAELLLMQAVAFPNGHVVAGYARRPGVKAFHFESWIILGGRVSHFGSKDPNNVTDFPTGQLPVDRTASEALLKVLTCVGATSPR